MIPSPFVNMLAGTIFFSIIFHNSGKTSTQQWDNFFGIIVFQFVGHLPIGYGIWFYCDCAASYHLAAATSLSLDVGYLFLVGSSILLSMVVQQLVAILVLSQEEMSTCPSTLPSLTGI